MTAIGDKWVSECQSVTLYCGRAEDVLPSLPPQSVDLVFTDPPYPGLTGGYRHTFDGVCKTQKVTESIGDRWGATLEWCKPAKDVAKFGSAVFCTHHSVAELSEQFSEWRKVALLTWYKRNAPPTGKNVPRFTSEFVWCFAKRPGIQWDAMETTVFDVPNIQGGCMATERIVDATGACVHPTQKPLALVQGLMERWNPLSVLDPFMGTGTAGVAAVRLGKTFIGCELDPHHFATAKDRIKAELRSRRDSLFDPVPFRTQQTQQEMFAQT